MRNPFVASPRAVERAAVLGYLAGTFITSVVLFAAHVLLGGAA